MDFTCNVHKEFPLFVYMGKVHVQRIIMNVNIANYKMLGMRTGVFFRPPGSSLASNNAPTRVREWM